MPRTIAEVDEARQQKLLEALQLLGGRASHADPVLREGAAGRRREIQRLVRDLLLRSAEEDLSNDLEATNLRPSSSA
jgi:hypothetical protein